MRPFSPSFLAYFAAVSATLIQLTEAAAIPRTQIDADSSSTSESDHRMMVYSDGSRPRLGFVVPNQKRAAGSKNGPTAMPAPPKLAKAASASSSNKTSKTSAKAKGKKPSSASTSKSTPMHDNAQSSSSTSSHKNHAQHVPGEHHRGSKSRSVKGGSHERRSKVDKRFHVASVSIGGGRFGHNYATNRIVSRGDAPKAPTYHVYGAGPAELTIPVTTDSDAPIVKRHHDHDYDHDGEHQHEHDHDRRSLISLDVPGTVDIKSLFPSAEVQLKLASLVLGADPSTNASFVMSASNISATPVYLHVNTNASASSDADGNAVKVVSLRVPVFDRVDATEAEYCAQFDPNPSGPVPLTAELCLDDVLLANATSTHVSQNFAYTPATGAIAPLWANSTAPPQASAPVNGTSSSAVPAVAPAPMPMKRDANCETPAAPTTQFTAASNDTAAWNSTATSNSSSSNVSSSATKPNSGMGVMMYFTPLTSAEVYSVEASVPVSNVPALASSAAPAPSSAMSAPPAPPSAPVSPSSAPSAPSSAPASWAPPAPSAGPPSSAPVSPPGAPTAAAPSPPARSAPAPSASSAPPVVQANAVPPSASAPASMPAPAPSAPAPSAPASPPVAAPSMSSGSAPAPPFVAITVTAKPASSTPSATPSPSAAPMSWGASPSAYTTTTTITVTSTASGSAPTASGTASAYEWLFTPDGGS